MLEAIQKLLVLQDRDVALAKAKATLANIPQELAHIKEEFEKASQHLLALKAQAKKIEIERKEREGQVQEKKALIAKYRTRQLETRKNEEYQALTLEIGRTEEAISKLEEQELVLMEQYESAQKDVAIEALQVEEKSKKSEEARKYLQEKEQNLQKRKEELESEIQKLEQQIETPALQQYRRILASKKNVALVELAHGNTCGGCHMKVTHQTAILVKAAQQLVFCEQCGRILYGHE